MKKAFVFTLDALFAASILAVFLAAISLELNVPKETYWLPELGANFMTVLDKTGVFSNMLGQTDAQAQAALTAYLNTLPANVNAKITVKIYTGAGDVFTLQRTIQSSKGSTSLAQETHVKRIFSGLGNNYFGIAELVLSHV